MYLEVLKHKERYGCWFFKAKKHREVHETRFSRFYKTLNNLEQMYVKQAEFNWYVWRLKIKKQEQVIYFHVKMQ